MESGFRKRQVSGGMMEFKAERVHSKYWFKSEWVNLPPFTKTKASSVDKLCEVAGQRQWCAAYGKVTNHHDFTENDGLRL